MATAIERMDLMPKVGQKQYPYTKKGKQQAKVAAKKMGTAVKYGKKKKAY